MGIDRRTQYTRMVIREALYKLLKKNPLVHITVKEICEEAQINRATFYRNYRDIYDLFESIEQELSNEAFPEESIPQNLSNFLQGNVPESLSKFLQGIYDNQVFYKEFYRHHLESQYVKQVVSVMQESVAEQIKAEGKFDEQEYELSFQYAFHGIVGCMQNWVEEGCKQDPKIMATLLSRIARRQLLP